MFPEKEVFAAKFFGLINSPVDVIQLRFKDLNDGWLFRVARRLVAEAKKRNIPVIINDRPDAALALGCSGVHLGKGDIPASIARKLLGRGAIIGRTIRNKKDLFAARSPDYDYVAVGPVFKTPVKSGLRQISLAALREIRRLSNKPVIAIGGINKGNVRKVVGEGIRTVAFMRYGLSEKNTKQRIEELRRKLNDKNT